MRAAVCRLMIYVSIYLIFFNLNLVKNIKYFFTIELLKKYCQVSTRTGQIHSFCLFRNIIKKNRSDLTK